MKNLKTNLAITAVLTAFIITSCQETETSSISSGTFLSSTSENGRSYFISSAEIDLIDVNGTLILDECVTDNTITYYPNGRYEENEGRSKCNIDDAPGSIGTWILTNNDQQISISIGGITEIWNIVSINNHGHMLTRATSDGEVTFILERLF